MFTGIIGAMGKVISIEKNNFNLTIEIESLITKKIKIGQRIAHNGVCLTVEKISPSKKQYTVTAVKETLLKTNFEQLKKNDLVNLELSLLIGDRLDGHFVQGHVDSTAIIKSIKQKGGSWQFEFTISGSTKQKSQLVINKGSVCINGVSLTVIETRGNSFSVAIIPHTFKHTNFHTFKNGDKVNIEFDVLGKYIQKIIQNR